MIICQRLYYVIILSNILSFQNCGNNGFLRLPWLWKFIILRIWNTGFLYKKIKKNIKNVMNVMCVINCHNQSISQSRVPETMNFDWKSFSFILEGVQKKIEYFWVIYIEYVAFIYVKACSDVNKRNGMFTVI